jgi:hypothetical protein
MAKRSRRARREETPKQAKATAATPAVAVQETIGLPAKTPATAPKVEAMLANQRKTLDFAQEYFFVFYDIRNVAIIGVLMFVVLVVLSFAI